MLERVDRIQLVVQDRARAARTFETLLQARVVGDTPSEHLRARRTILAVGESEVELCEPTGLGPARDHLDRWGEGLLSAGFATAGMGVLRARLARAGARVVEDGEQLYLEPTETFGMRVVVTPARPVRPAPSRLYEVTNTLVSDWKVVAAQYTALFGLQAHHYSPIRSDRFGYTGALLLFDPPTRLDRIELSQVVDPGSAMGRWVARRGDSLYMCYLETDDVEDLAHRLREAGARWTPRGSEPARERDGLWVHPTALHGLLLGVSRTTLAWEWSGRPGLVTPLTGRG